MESQVDDSRYNTVTAGFDKLGRQHFYDSYHRWVSREQIARSIWGDEMLDDYLYGDSRAADADPSVFYNQNNFGPEAEARSRGRNWQRRQETDESAAQESGGWRRFRRKIRDKALGATMLGTGLVSRGYDRFIRRPLSREDESGERHLNKRRTVVLAAVAALAVTAVGVYWASKTGQAPKPQAPEATPDLWPNAESDFLTLLDAGATPSQAGAIIERPDDFRRLVEWAQEYTALTGKSYDQAGQDFIRYMEVNQVACN